MQYTGALSSFILNTRRIKRTLRLLLLLAAVIIRPSSELIITAAVATQCAIMALWFSR